jgi:hypothetical protein
MVGSMFEPLKTTGLMPQPTKTYGYVNENICAMPWPMKTFGLMP